MVFAGFRPEVAGFFAGLRRNNDKVWFDQHRNEWTELVKQPMETLLAEAQREYGPGRVMRINRDVRFGADKSPYRTSASMWAGGVGGVYLSVSDAGLQVGGGLYEPSRDQLARARNGIDERPQVAAALQRALDELMAAGFETAGPSLTTAPRGYSRDHPRIGLLRLRHFAALRPLPLTVAPEAVHETWRRVQSLNGWVDRWVGPAERWP